MARRDSARVFATGGSQAVRIPRQFWFSGDRVRVRPTPQGLLLKPMFAHTGEWMLQLDEVKAEIRKSQRKAEKKSRRASLRSASQARVGTRTAKAGAMKSDSVKAKTSSRKLRPGNLEK